MKTIEKGRILMVSAANNFTSLSSDPPVLPGDAGGAPSFAKEPGAPEPGQAKDAAPTIQHKHKKAERSRGLKIFDFLLYPLFTNIAVWTFSVWITYKTNFGNPNSILRTRGDKFKSWVIKHVPSEKFAQNANMVLWSFVDGSFIAPFVKLFEDRRTPIAKWIDKKTHSDPVDPSVYNNEPKQSWGSVLGGRIITLGMVISAFKILNIEKIKGDETTSFNHLMFDKPAQWFTDRSPGLKNRFSAEKVHGLTKTILFEAFYTSLCTLGLYVWSRGIARFFNKKLDERVEAVIARHESGAGNGTHSSISVASPQQEEDKSVSVANKWVEKPVTKSIPQKTENYVANVDASRGALAQQL